MTSKKYRAKKENNRQKKLKRLAKINPKTNNQWRNYVMTKKYDVTEVPAMPADMTKELDTVGAVMKLLKPNLDVSKLAGDLVNVCGHAIASANHYKGLYEGLSKNGKIERIDVKADSPTVKLSWFDRLSTDITLSRTIGIRGPAGNGKSTGAKYVLEEKGYKVYHLDCTDSTTVDQLIGGIVPVSDGKGGINMEFRDGVVAKAFKDPKGAILFDEFDSLDPRVAICLQSVLHRNSGGNGKRKASASDHPDGYLISKGDCPVVVTMNTYGNGATREYVGRNAMDAASMDRFDTIIDTDYEMEKEILQARFGEEKATKYSSELERVLTKAVEIRKLIQERSLRIIFSTRRVIDIAESIIVLGMDPTSAFAREFKTRLAPAEIAALAGTPTKK